MRMRSLAVSLGVFAFAAAAHAGNWPPVSGDLPMAGGGENDSAVIIGVTDYFKLPDIPGAGDNATDWFTYLAKTRGIPQDRVELLRDGEATKETMLKAAHDAAAKAGPGGTVWFIYIGHGAPNASHDDGLIIGADTQLTEDSLVARGLPQKEIIGAIEADAKHAHAIIVWDACFSGSTGDGKALVPGSQATVPVKRIAPGEKGRAAIFSASDLVAGPLPGHDRPAFSYLLLGALRGWADTPPTGNGDHTVTTIEAFNYARDTLRTMVRGRNQVPSLSGSAEQFALSTGASEAGPDLVKMKAAIAPANDLFRGTQVEVPVIDTSAFSNLALRDMNMAAEHAWENVQDNTESSSATSTAKRDSWCALSAITDRNPYLEVAQTACTKWKGYVEAEANLEQSLTTDYGVLVDYMSLRHRSTEMKIGAIDMFVGAYEKYADRQEVLAAKVARDNLENGKAPGIALDTDGDHLLIDACPSEAEDVDGDNDDDGCPEKSAGEIASAAVEEAGLHFYIFDFEHPFYESGLGGGLGVFDEPGVPTKFDQPTYRPSLGAVNRAGWGPLEVGLNLDWDLARDLDDDAFSLDAYGGVRVIGVSAWTPSIGLDYRNAFDWAKGRAGGPGFYFANAFSFGGAVTVRLTYRYGLEAPGGLVPIHAVFLESFIMIASPSGSAFLDLMDELDLCD